VVGLRPEDFDDAAFARGRPTISARVDVLEELGSDAHIFFTVDAPPMTAEALETAVGGGLPATQALFAARVDPRTTARVGDVVELSVDTRRFHFFDPHTGSRLAADGVPELVAH
jgi:multiple sugar transport system ATP-binding protein